MSGLSFNPLVRARSLLFAPGHLPQRFDKALASEADAVILDLEDAVAPQDKAMARMHVGTYLRTVDPTLLPRLVARLNAPEDSNEHKEDLRWLEQLGPAMPAGLMLPKATAPAELAAVAQAAGKGCALLPLIESAKGWQAADALADAPQVLRLVFGHLDFQLDMGMACGPAQDELAPVRLALVAASRRAGLASPVDGVTPDFQDDSLTKADVARSRRFGFGGKLCIHPRQVALTHAGFAHTSAEIEWAERVVQANQQAAGAVFQLDGRMVDAPVLRKAERILHAIR